MKHTVHIKDVPANCHAASVLLNRLYSLLEQRHERKACKKFLQEELKKHGTLVCYYCGKSDLKLKTDKQHEHATVDHFIPKSKGGDPWDHANFVVCCNSCNKKKASHDADVFKCSKYISRKKASLPKL